MMTDPIADLLTRIRNALGVGIASVRVPHSKMKTSILDVLAREGFIQGWETVEKAGTRKEMLVHLKYQKGRQPVIEGLRRISRPGCRVYASKGKLPSVRGGLGIAILSTSKGIMTDAEARTAGVGGEVICNVW